MKFINNIIVTSVIIIIIIIIIIISVLLRLVLLKLVSLIKNWNCGYSPQGNHTGQLHSAT